MPNIPEYGTNNAHMFYLICNSLEERTKLIAYLKANEILSVFHYISLHSSPYYMDKYDGGELSNCDMYADSLVRLPMYYELKLSQVDYIVSKIKECFEK